ncbi:MAG: N-acetylmuramoyl-L-alanine amidase [Candidatus Symbiothrix sp.]|jgi:N-acetylmuramoyl-L-alanine amidase|nr:N-acetylmuramoyl-L-alanine amidase [Candidatus Symbiothrix sp.]
MREIKEIIVHCTATPEGRETTIADIDRWHRARGFEGIGYHYVVYLDGTIHAGRPETKIGAHCTGHNAGSIGVCYVGGIDASTLKAKDTRTDAQRKGLKKVIENLRQKYPLARVYGHRDFAAKACPCFDAKKEYN